MSRRRKNRQSLKDKNKEMEKLNNHLVEQLKKAEHALNVLKQDTMIWIQVLQFDFMEDHSYQISEGKV